LLTRYIATEGDDATTPTKKPKSVTKKGIAKKVVKKNVPKDNAAAEDIEKSDDEVEEVMEA
jgi:hypothetical protein